MITVRDFDLSPLIRRMERVMPEVIPLMDQILEEKARLIVSSSGSIPGMAQSIPPSHEGVTGASAGKYGQAKVAGDISRVYLTPSRAYADIRDHAGKPAADAFYGAMNGRTVTTRNGRTRRLKGTPDEAQRLLRATSSRYSNVTVGRFDGGEAHRNLRLKDGTIGKRVVPRMVVLDPKALGAYIKHKQGNVGIMASAFNAAADALGARGIPSFIKRHGSQFSSFQVLRTRTAMWIVMTPRLNFGMDEINRRWMYVLQYREKAIDSRGYLTRIRKVFLEPASSTRAAA